MAKVAIPEITRFMVDCLVAVGTPRVAAEQQADLLVEADKRGHRSHGLNRLEHYVNGVKFKICNPHNSPEILKETASTAWVEANNVLGAQAGNFCLDLASKKARDTGIGWIVVKGSNHYGISGYWTGKLADEGFIGITFTNTSPLVAPTRAKQAALGTNPLAVTAPSTPEVGPFHLDMATSAVALGKIEMLRRRGAKLKPGWAIGPDGKETLDAELAIKSGCLMPLGGSEESGGYKGFGLAALVEMLSATLGGGSLGVNVPKWSRHGDGTARNLGQAFVALDHKCFAPGFEERLASCIKYWRSMPPADPAKPVIAPGDIEKRTLAAAEKAGSITYITQLIDSYDKLAKKLNVRPLERQ